MTGVQTCALPIYGARVLLNSGSNHLALLIVNWNNCADRRPVVDKALELCFLKTGWVDRDAGSAGLEARGSGGLDDGAAV